MGLGLSTPSAFQVADKYADRVKGKHVVITGATTGVGKGIAEACAHAKAAHITFAARNADKADALIKELKEKYSFESVSFVKLELSSLKSTEQCAEAIIGLGRKIDVLFCNAGLVSFDGNFHTCANDIIEVDEKSKSDLTEDDALARFEALEHTFVCNYLSHFLLCHLLKPHITDGGRIVHTSSFASYGFHNKGKMNLERDLPITKATFSRMYTYGFTKLAQIFHAYVSNKEWSTEGAVIRSFAINPGFVSSGMIDQAGPLAAGIIRFVSAPLARDIYQGAATAVFCGFADEAVEILEKNKDKLLLFYNFEPMTEFLGIEVDDQPEKLWKRSFEILGKEPEGGK